MGKLSVTGASPASPSKRIEAFAAAIFLSKAASSTISKGAGDFVAARNVRCCESGQRQLLGDRVAEGGIGDQKLDGEFGGIGAWHRANFGDFLGARKAAKNATIGLSRV